MGMLSVCFTQKYPHQASMIIKRKQKQTTVEKDIKIGKNEANKLRLTMGGRMFRGN